jgi:hypothetical protein
VLCHWAGTLIGPPLRQRTLMCPPSERTMCQCWACTQSQQARRSPLSSPAPDPPTMLTTAQKLKATADKVVEDTTRRVYDDLVKLLRTADERGHAFQRAAQSGAHQINYSTEREVGSIRHKVYQGVYARLRDAWMTQAVPPHCQMYNQSMPPVLDGFAVNYSGNDWLTICWRTSPCVCGQVHELTVLMMAID